MSNDINKNNFFIYFISKQEWYMKDETAIKELENVLDFRCVFFLSAMVWQGVTLFRAQIETILTRVSKTKCDQQFFLNFFLQKLRLLFFRAKFVCQSESSNRKLSSKCLLFRVYGKGWKFWMPTRKSKENFKNQKGSSIWGEDLVLILVLSLERRSTGPWVSLRLGWPSSFPGQCLGIGIKIHLARSGLRTLFKTRSGQISAVSKTNYRTEKFHSAKPRKDYRIWSTPWSTKKDDFGKRALARRLISTGINY